ncbi:hypothetical protein H072_9268 [Dactylellina haptotyla CBS 200.50]|uniref:FAD dependent oxidoreductase domain-containing protein n=1 Tax=Dactylellina haptotyla (strain CBS 200.50) TaxID=1284197 RepID=S8A7K5_DACHA|nr:hypothetical protein H072_9268 [Dactylellina haptotyla CBS 200.50]
MSRKIVVIGGGIVGVSTAYFLSHHHSKPSVTLIEASSIAAGASGKAGGLLALDWHGSDTASLARLSYELHASLADKHSGRERWGYRELNTVEISCQAGKTRNGRPTGVPNWVNPDTVLKVGSLGTPRTTAQIHPRRFCEALIQECKDLEIIIAHARKVLLSGDKSAIGVETEVNGEVKIIEADTVVVAAGPWTTKLLPNVPISTQRAHSITVQTAEPASPHALFTSIRTENGNVVTPEIYPRVDEIYACGDLDTNAPLPKLAREVQVDEERCREIKENVGLISDLLKEGVVTCMQACYLPYSEIGPGPSIGWVPGMKNVAVAAGHSCWGICNGPGTGKVMSELVCEDKISSAKVETLDPSRYTQ